MYIRKYTHSRLPVFLQVCAMKIAPIYTKIASITKRCECICTYANTLTAVSQYSLQLCAMKIAPIYTKIASITKRYLGIQTHLL